MEDAVVPDGDVISSTGPRGAWRASGAMPEKRGTLVMLMESAWVQG